LPAFACDYQLATDDYVTFAETRNWNYWTFRKGLAEKKHYNRQNTKKQNNLTFPHLSVHTDAHSYKNAEPWRSLVQQTKQLCKSTGRVLAKERRLWQNLRSQVRNDQIRNARNRTTRRLRLRVQVSVEISPRQPDWSLVVVWQSKCMKPSITSPQQLCVKRKTFWSV